MIYFVIFKDFIYCMVIYFSLKTVFYCILLLIKFNVNYRLNKSLSMEQKEVSYFIRSILFMDPQLLKY